MFCWNCGKQNPEDSAFCLYCGSSLEGDPSKMRANIPETSALNADIPETSALNAGSASPNRPSGSAAPDSDEVEEENGTTILGTDDDYTFSPGQSAGGSSHSGQGGHAGGASYSGQSAGSSSYSGQGNYSSSSSYPGQDGYPGGSSYSGQGGYAGSTQGNVPPASYTPDEDGKKKSHWIFIVLIAIIAAAVIVIVVAFLTRGNAKSSSETTDTVVETTTDTSESTAEESAESSEDVSSDLGLSALTEASSTSYGLYGTGTNSNSLPGLSFTASIPADAESGNGDVLTLTFTNTSETAYSLGGSGTYYVALICANGKRYEFTGSSPVTVPAGGSIQMQYDISQAEGTPECIIISPFYAGDSYDGSGTFLSTDLELKNLNDVESGS